MENKPIKRSKYLVALSSDHHFGLLFCSKIKSGLDNNVELNRIETYINYFAEHHLKAHFNQEDELLFNKIDDGLCYQAKAEHRMLIERLNRLNYYENEEARDYTLFAELLIKHIRFEERILFPHLENVMPLSILHNVCGFLTQQHQVPFNDNYPDEFWKKQANA